ncbi:MAG: CHAT domain-containing protein [Limisphaerales bacterium]
MKILTKLVLAALILCSAFTASAQSYYRSTTTYGYGLSYGGCSSYAPLAAYLTNVSHLIVCPDGQLSRLPFEALPCGQNKFLIEEKNHQLRHQRAGNRSHRKPTQFKIKN